MTLYIKYKFYEILSIGYLAIAEDGKTDGRADGWTEGWTDNAKPIYKNTTWLDQGRPQSQN